MPVASASLAPPAPRSGTALRLALSPDSSVRFVMDAPLERIEGDAPRAVGGELHVELADLARSSGVLKIDLDKLELFQQKRSAAGEPLGERRRNELQNAHARDWLELVPREGEVSAADAADHRWVEFKLDRISELSARGVLPGSGGERRVTALIGGTLRLHGRTARSQARVELGFRFDGERLERLTVKSVKPVPVSLAAFDVHPRDTAGKLLQTVAEAVAGKLKGKLASEARVEFTLLAVPAR